MIGVSTHSAAEVASAESHGANFAVFGPVFEKSGSANREGLEQLRRICHRTETAQPPMPVWALGGITLENAGSARQQEQRESRRSGCFSRTM